MVWTYNKKFAVNAIAMERLVTDMPFKNYLF